MSAPVIVAHRAANDPGAVAAAAAHADVVEADVHLFRGRLEVRHAKTLGPVRVLWERWYLLPRDTPRVELDAALSAVGPGTGLLLDLKGPDPRLPARVLSAARERIEGPGLMISARVWRTADRLLGTPGVRAFHSVGSRRQLRALVRRYPPGALQGVCVRRDLLDPAAVEGLRRRAAHVWSWPVDDVATGRALTGWGVTGLISDAPERLEPLRVTREPDPRRP